MEHVENLEKQLQEFETRLLNLNMENLEIRLETVERLLFLTFKAIGLYDLLEEHTKKRYVVKIPNTNSVLHRFKNDVVYMFDDEEIINDDCVTEFTEHEIKEHFNWAWELGFVEEVKNDTKI